MRVAGLALAVLALGPGLAAAQEGPPEGPPAEAPPEPAQPGAVTTEQCVDAHLQNQKLRKQGKLTEARDSLLVCVQEGCPDPIRAECAGWLGELDAQIPSIVVTALDAKGNDTVDVRVTIDGLKVADRLDGRPQLLDPGPHKIGCEHGGKSQVTDVVTVQGQRDRPVICDFREKKKEPEPVAVDKGHPIAAYVLGALSLGAFASFAGFGIVGKREADDLETSCGKSAPAPNTNTCTEDEIDPVRNKLIAADVSLGVGVALLAVGVGLFLHHHLSDPDPPVSAIRIDLGPTAGGAAGLVTISF